MKIVAIIPARMGSTRFPGKPLFKLVGKPMIEHVYKRVCMSPVLTSVFVATCDREIYETVQGFGGKAVMTENTHERCTDRIAEAAHKMVPDADIIVNIQGDEPLIMPEQIDKVVAPLLKEPNLSCVNLVTPIIHEEEFRSYNAVKAVLNNKGDIIYFSREPIPSIWKGFPAKQKKYKQLGIIAFRGDFLKLFTELSPTPLEIVESVDMLRALEHGFTVRAVETVERMIGVDVPGDAKEVELILQRDKLLNKYN